MHQKDNKNNSKWEVNKKELYSEICTEIIGRCKFLLSIITVEPELIIPTMIRSKSMENSGKQQSSATTALTAWQHIQSNDLLTLKYASPEQRPSLIWKYVLSFLDEKVIDCELMIKRIKFDRIKSRLQNVWIEDIDIFLKL